MQEIESGGVGAMEMVSRDMKALGMYLSGSISFGLCPQSGKAVEYRERIHRLTQQQREMYNRAAAAWQAHHARPERARTRQPETDLARYWLAGS
jgi:P-loop containing NTP hydrolase pore-1